jgi:hypothetical protein
MSLLQSVRYRVQYANVDRPSAVTRSAATKQSLLTLKRRLVLSSMLPGCGVRRRGGHQRESWTLPMVMESAVSILLAVEIGDIDDHGDTVPLPLATASL